MTSNVLTPRGPKPNRISPSRIILYSILVVAAMYYLLPLYVMVATSLKDLDQVREGNIFAWPLRAGFDAWIKAWDTACTGLYCEGLKVGFWKSVQITVPSVIASIAIASVNGYALSYWRFRGSEVFFTILIIGSFIPYQVMLYPLVIITRELGIFGTLPGVIFIHSIFGMPILTLLFRNYFAALPVELFKAARVDGAGFWGIFFQIMLPMSIPILVVDHSAGDGDLERLPVRCDLRRNPELAHDRSTQQHREHDPRGQRAQRQHGCDHSDGLGAAYDLLHLRTLFCARHRCRRCEGLNP